MLSAISVLFKSQTTFKHLSGKSEVERYTNCDIIFIFYGAINGFATFYFEKEFLETRYGNLVYLLWVLAGIIGVLIGLLFGRYLFPWLIFVFSKLVSGKAKVIDLRVSVAYALIPVILLITGYMFTWVYHFHFFDTNLFAVCYQLFYWLMWLWALKVLFQGVRFYNQFSKGKALFCISPFVIFLIGRELLNRGIILF